MKYDFKNKVKPSQVIYILHADINYIFTIFIVSRTSIVLIDEQRVDFAHVKYVKTNQFLLRSNPLKRII